MGRGVLALGVASVVFSVISLGADSALIALGCGTVALVLWIACGVRALGGS